MKIVLRAAVALFVVCLALVSAGPADASAPYTYDSSTGYYYDGNGVAYTRTDAGSWYRYKYTNYDYYGRVYYTYGPWQWESNYVYTPVAVNAASGFDSARSTLLRIKEGQARLENRIRERAAETMLLNEQAKILGVQGNLYVNDLTGNPFGGYLGGNGGFGATGLFSGNAAGQQNGNTQYGYTYKQTADAYGQTDVNALHAQRSRTTDRVIDLTDRAIAGDKAIVGQVDTNAARLAEIEANRKLAEAIPAILKALQPQPQTHTTTTITGSGTTSVQAPALASPAAVFDRAAWLKQPGPASCVACHGAGAASQKAFDLMAYDPEVSPLRPKVLECMSGQSKTCKMPKDGTALSASAQLQLLTRQVLMLPAKE